MANPPLNTGEPSSSETQVGLDGIKLLDPSRKTTLRIYPLEHVTRWTVGLPCRVVFMRTFLDACLERGLGLGSTPKARHATADPNPQVKDPTILTFYVKTSVDSDERSIHLSSDERTTRSILVRLHSLVRTPGNCGGECPSGAHIASSLCSSSAGRPHVLVPPAL